MASEKRKALITRITGQDEVFDIKLLEAVFISCEILNNV